jgi:uncharacterized protein (TIGR00369 family)
MTGAADVTNDPLFQRMVAEWQTSSMAKTMRMRLLEARDGAVMVEAFPGEAFYNPQRRVHGGYVATLIDSGLGCAVQTKLAWGTGYGTVELHVNYVRKLVAETGRLLCRASVLHAGRTMFTAEAKVADEAGKLYAHGTGTFLVYP